MHIQIRTPDDIAGLPWAGNFADDLPLFELVEDYIRSEPNRWKRQQADVLVSVYGMGEPCEIDPDFDPAEVLRGRA